MGRAGIGAENRAREDLYCRAILSLVSVTVVVIYSWCTGESTGCRQMDT